MSPEKLGTGVGDIETPLTLADELPGHLKRISVARSGISRIGLGLNSMPKLEQATGGLRGLMLLAAAPNVGKTSLAVQLGLDAVQSDPNTCFLFLSLEMPRAEIITRLLCNMARIEWSRLVLEAGMEGISEDKEDALEEAQEVLTGLGERIMILDATNFPEPTVEGALAWLAELKSMSGCNRALILVDYLQVFPLPPDVRQERGLTSDLDVDRWRIGAMKQLRDVSGDAVLVISEVNKPREGKLWAHSIEDITGSARGIYTPDMVFLLQALNEEESALELGGNPHEARATLRRLGMTFNRFIIAKGRDGVTRGSFELTFFYRQARFAQGFRHLF
jgi:hypothetical protein